MSIRKLMITGVLFVAVGSVIGFVGSGSWPIVWAGLLPLPINGLTMPANIDCTKPIIAKRPGRFPRLSALCSRVLRAWVGILFRSINNGGLH